MTQLPPPTNITLSGIELFDFRSRQDIQGGNSKNSAKRKVEEIEGSNHHSVNPTRILILEKKDDNNITNKKPYEGSSFVTTEFVWKKI